MKKFTCLLLMCTMCMGAGFSSTATLHAKPVVSAKEEVRAVWITSVWHIDFPTSASVGNAEAQKKEFIGILDNLQEMGFNTVMVQVRPRADAFYQSEINPWSEILTGTQGKDPGYDPMTFMIEETHKRGMAFHAWLNPYRVMSGQTDLSTLAENNFGRMHPEWTFVFDNNVCLDPAVPEVQQHIADSVGEIVANYNVDGIHFDDYFYPYNYPLPAGEVRDGEVCNQRREDINNMVRLVRETINRIDSSVEFGISPFGVWKNKSSDPAGSDTNNLEAYYAIFADAKAWIQNGWIDYIVPQLYWEVGHPTSDYRTVVEWWSEAVRGTDVKLYAGQGIYKEEIASTIEECLYENSKYKEVVGNVYFTYRDFRDNLEGVADSITAYHQGLDEKVALPTDETSFKEAVITGNGVNMRTNAGRRYPSVGHLQEGDTVKVFHSFNGWHKVQRSDGRVGYVIDEYIDIDSQMDIFVNEEKVVASQMPFEDNEEIFVPLRAISEALGATVEWDAQTKKVTIEDRGNKVIVNINSKIASLNGRTFMFSKPPVVIDGVTMVPSSVIADGLGAKVEWVKRQFKVNITR